MQKTTLIVALSLCISMLSGVAQARTSKKTTVSTSSERIETYQAAPEHHSGGVTFSLGLSTISPIATSIGNITTGATGSITGILNITNLDAIQILVNIPSTTGGFSFGIAGLYKRTLVGNEAVGFHVGGGIGLGTIAGNFAMSIPALIGLHYTLSNLPVTFHLDGGPAFSLVSIPGVLGSSTATNFSMQPLSGLLGASAVYNF